MPKTRSPFHRGEKEIQSRLGIEEKAESLGRRMIHDQMPGQHQAFFAGLPPPKYQSAYQKLVGYIDDGLAGVIRGQLVICGVNGILTYIQGNTGFVVSRYIAHNAFLSYSQPMTTSELLLSLLAGDNFHDSPLTTLIK